MEQVLADLLVNGGLHGALAVAVIVLWRENRRLQEKLESLRLVQASSHAILLDQNDQLRDIKAQTSVQPSDQSAK